MFSLIHTQINLTLGIGSVNKYKSININVGKFNTYIFFNILEVVVFFQ